MTSPADQRSTTSTTNKKRPRSDNSNRNKNQTDLNLTGAKKLKGPNRAIVHQTPAKPVIDFWAKVVPLARRARPFVVLGDPNTTTSVSVIPQLPEPKGPPPSTSDVLNSALLYSVGSCGAGPGLVSSEQDSSRTGGSEVDDSKRIFQGTCV
jgi:hypothetical protein